MPLCESHRWWCLLSYGQICFIYACEYNGFWSSHRNAHAALVLRKLNFPLTNMWIYIYVYDSTPWIIRSVFAVLSACAGERGHCEWAKGPRRRRLTDKVHIREYKFVDAGWPTTNMDESKATESIWSGVGVRWCVVHIIITYTKTAHKQTHTVIRIACGLSIGTGFGYRPPT